MTTITTGSGKDDDDDDDDDPSGGKEMNGPTRSSSSDGVGSVAGVIGGRSRSRSRSKESRRRRRRSDEEEGGGAGGGWKYAFGSNDESVALYRICLGLALSVELISRFQYLHPFYSDEGTLPLRLLLPKTDPMYKLVCLHCYSGSMFYQRLLLSVQVLLSIMLVVGYKTRFASIWSWILYLSLTLRNTWLNFILDRYFHHLLFYSMFMRLDGAWSIEGGDDNKDGNAIIKKARTFVTPATIAFKLYIAWLYFDAGYGKYTDPLRGWTLDAHPLPALDTYVRHTAAARYVYGLLGPVGLRLMTPTVVYVELLGVPTAFLASYFSSYGRIRGGRRSSDDDDKKKKTASGRTVLYCTIGLMCSMHVGIALTMNNTVLLSLVACVAWCIFLPEGVGDDLLSLLSSSSSSSSPSPSSSSSHSPSRGGTSGSGEEREREANGKGSCSSEGGGFLSIVKRHGMSTLAILSFISGSVWFETMSAQCNQSMEHIWSTLLHNRWNVFVGAEEYVTWEIAPGRLLDGSIVDVWSKSDAVSWDMPGAGAPCTSTARAGRWRSFPYLAELDGEDGDALWSYLCRQWDDETNVNVPGNGGKRLLRYNFFMLQADVLPDMGFSATRKRLVHSHDCLSDSNFAKEEVKEEKMSGGFEFAFSGEL